MPQRRPSLMKNMYRQRFGDLLVMTRAGNTRNGTVMWHCICSCGKRLLVDGAKLRRGRIKHCGRLLHDPRRQVSKAVREENPNEYWLWNNLKQRCRNRKNPRYRHYGAKGVKFSREWKRFEQFLRDVGKRPSPDHWLVRIDSAGGYGPGNVEWRLREDVMRERFDRLPPVRCDDISPETGGAA